MKLSELLGTFRDGEVTGISFDPKKVKRGDLFFALKNPDFAAIEAEKRGAIAIVAEKRVPVSVPLIRVDNARRTFALVSKKFYGNAADDLTVCAVTGTNGKTTVTYITQAILNHAGFKTAVIGTNGTDYDGVHENGTLTTPDPNDFHEILRRLKADGAEIVVIEASAHALALDKLCGTDFAVGAFTSLGSDHLDFFGTTENYGKAKEKLFSLSRSAVINADDAFGAAIAAKLADPLTYGLKRNCDLTAENISSGENGSTFDAAYKGERAEVFCPLIGEFNVYNSLCAIGIAIELGVPFSAAAAGVSKTPEVDGRVNVIKSNGATVIIDFAHTADGLSGVLTAARKITANRLYCVFGCGGNRDEGKREKMGEVAARVCDEVIITSDNPRYENPLDIISEIERGIKTSDTVEYSVEPDRKQAIKKAVGKLEAGDVLVIAGKGAERYQEINGERIEHDDKAYVLGLLGEKR